MASLFSNVSGRSPRKLSPSVSALMAGSTLLRSTAWSWPNQSTTCRILGANSSTSFGLREILAVSARQGTSGGWREYLLVVDEQFLKLYLKKKWNVDEEKPRPLVLILGWKIWQLGVEAALSTSRALLPILTSKEPALGYLIVEVKLQIQDDRRIFMPHSQLLSSKTWRRFKKLPITHWNLVFSRSFFPQTPQIPPKQRLFPSYPLAPLSTPLVSDFGVSTCFTFRFSGYRFGFCAG